MLIWRLSIVIFSLSAAYVSLRASRINRKSFLVLYFSVESLRLFLLFVIGDFHSRAFYNVSMFLLAPMIALRFLMLLEMFLWAMPEAEKEELVAVPGMIAGVALMCYLTLPRFGQMELWPVRISANAALCLASVGLIIFCHDRCDQRMKQSSTMLAIYLATFAAEIGLNPLTADAWMDQNGMLYMLRAMVLIFWGLLLTPAPRPDVITLRPRWRAFWPFGAFGNAKSRRVR